MTCRKEFPELIQRKNPGTLKIMMMKSNRKYCSKICRVSNPVNKEKVRINSARTNKIFQPRVSRDCLHCGNPTFKPDALFCTRKKANTKLAPTCRKDWHDNRMRLSRIPLTNTDLCF